MVLHSLFDLFDIIIQLVHNSFNSITLFIGWTYRNLKYYCKQFQMKSTLMNFLFKLVTVHLIRMIRHSHNVRLNHLTPAGCNSIDTVAVMYVQLYTAGF